MPGGKSDVEAILAAIGNEITKEELLICAQRVVAMCARLQL
jgi:GTP cyclohydrolase I